MSVEARIPSAAAFIFEGGSSLSLEATSTFSSTGIFAITPTSGAIVLTANTVTLPASVVGLGGTTSSFPALKRSSTTVQVRLGDDSGYAPLTASTLTCSVAVDFAAGAKATPSIKSTGSAIGGYFTSDSLLFGTTADDFLQIRSDNVILAYKVMYFYGGVNAPGGLDASNITTGNLAGTGYIKGGTFTVGTLPAAGTVGNNSRAYVTDSNLAFNGTNIGTAVATGGANHCPVVVVNGTWVIG